MAQINQSNLNKSHYFFDNKKKGFLKSEFIFKKQSLWEDTQVENYYFFKKKIKSTGSLEFIFNSSFVHFSFHK